MPLWQIWHLVVRLDDFLWYASHEWGGDNETAPVLHNYALSFALSRTDRIASSDGLPRYDEHLEPLDVYCTPGRIVAGSGARLRTVLTFNSVDNPTQLTQAMRLGEKCNDPKFGKRTVLVPGVRFEFVAFTRRGFALPRIFRLGKKLSPVVREQTEEVVGDVFEQEGDSELVPTHAINPLDVSGTVSHAVPRIIPPHMVYERAGIRSDAFVRSGRHVVHLPKRVRAWSE